MKYPTEAFQDVLRKVLMPICPNNEPEVNLAETDAFLDLWGKLKPQDHPFWKRVVLDYSANIFDRDLEFCGMFYNDILYNFERLHPNSLAQLSIYYYGINLGEWSEIEIDGDLYYNLHDEQISKYRLEKLIAQAICHDYNELHQYVAGFLKK